MTQTSKPLLIELFTEELPPKALPKLGQAFAQGIHDALHAQGRRSERVQTGSGGGSSGGSGYVGGGGGGGQAFMGQGEGQGGECDPIRERYRAGEGVLGER